jgi:glycosyltransferase involved in cell wall biosynthesis
MPNTDLPGHARQARVLHVVKLYRPDFSGEAVFLERSSLVMRALAPSVEHDLLVTRTPLPALADPAPAAGLARVIYLSTQRLSGLTWYFAFLRWFVVHQHHYRTIHFRTHIDWYFLAYLLARLSGRRLVHSATLDDTVSLILGTYRPMLRPLAARAMRLFHAYIAISPKLLEETRLAVDPARTHLVPCGITVASQSTESRALVRARLGVRDADPVLISVGALCARKDQAFLIEAMPTLLEDHPGLRLVLVGPTVEPDYGRALHAAVARLNLTERVIFAGQQQDPHPWFGAADIMVFASRQEGFGTVVPEAMAHGLPVVVRRLAGVNDWFVREAETGFLFDNQAGFIAATGALLRNPTLRVRIGAAAQAFARTSFDMRTIAANYLELYGFADRIVARPAVPAPLHTDDLLADPPPA